MTNKRIQLKSITRQSENHTDLLIRLTPNASNDQIIGIVQTDDNEKRLAVKVRAVADKGRANKAVKDFLAKKLSVPKSSVKVASGSTSRLKTIRIEGKPQTLVERLELLLT